MVNIYFLDSSALIKRYVVEIGSPWIKTLTDSQTGNSLLLVRITWVEVLSAFARRQREGGINAAEVAALIQNFRSEFNSRYRVIEVDEALVERAGELIVQYPLRAYDAVQLASALRVQSVLRSMPETQLIFVSADNRLLDIAQSAGLAIDNPNNYPSSNGS
ncbi:type II toxin-antitoxin system VapC family toxin [Tychonema sp. LEGE 07199]|uniref:PIN domain-containing protein n=1 Tax=Microcoleaceae TaxID=1892252 RepID=UPI00187FF636|nr:type II toxin-antitoxin system VapC family toxin [Tychonema sp. LEGE 07199]MBE9134702.1 type II toxin-antitoxin system VapC family toxin [Tychonema sp. LEGE 07196]